MNIDKVHEHIDACRERDLEVWKDLIRIPSVAAKNIGVKECCDALVDLLSGLGIKTQVFPTKGSPIVFGELSCGKPDAKTIMFYGHYDVQPPDPLDQWNTPPFEPTIVNGRMYGRGSGDNKGQFLAHILAVRSYLQSGEGLPVNVKFFLEGEEENGSKNVLDFIVPYKDLLKCDLVYNADGGMQPDGRPYIQFGVRGMLQATLELTTATRDNHSGLKGGCIPSAAWEMVKFLNTLIDSDGNCAIEGFYDAVVPPTEYEMELIDQLDFDKEAQMEVTGAKEINLDKKDYFLNMMFRPTFNINGLSSGYTGPGYRTIVTGSAVAKLDFRLVDAQDPLDIAEKLMRHVQKYRPDIKVTIGSQLLPSKTRPDLPESQAVIRAVERGYGKKAVVMPSTGATNPEYVFTKIAGLASVCVPYANADEQNHAPNENMDVELFYKGIHVSAEVIKEIGMLSSAGEAE